MNRRTNLVLKWLALALLLTSGCHAEAGDSPGGDGSGGGAASGGALTRIALAQTYGDYTGETRWGTGNPSPGRDAVWLHFGANAGFTCAYFGFPEPASEHVCEKRQELSVVIPYELLHPGRINLRDDRIFASVEADGADCSGGGVGAPEATLELLAISPGSIETNLEIATTPDTDALGGHYVATACGDLPAEPPPTTGVAILGANLPPHAVEGPIDATALYVFAGTEPSTCGDPASRFDCSGTFRTVFAIPAGEVVFGDRTLADLGATYVEAIHCDGWGNNTSGALRRGTVSITSADSAQISFRVSDSFDEAVGLGFDGVFTATLCL